MRLPLQSAGSDAEMAGKSTDFDRCLLRASRTSASSTLSLNFERYGADATAGSGAQYLMSAGLGHLRQVCAIFSAAMSSVAVAMGVAEAGQAPQEC